MTFTEFNIPAFFIYLVGCFLAVGLSLRAKPDNRILAQTYGLWIAAAFSAHHFLVPNAAQNWHYLWYVWNAGVSLFPILPAYMLKDAGARRPVAFFGAASTVLCLTYAAFSFFQNPLPGIIYFYGQHICEASQVLAMIIWSGPIVPICVRAWTAVTQGKWPWVHRISV